MAAYPADEPDMAGSAGRHPPEKEVKRQVPDLQLALAVVEC
jgi:hypothetical protein